MGQSNGRTVPASVANLKMPREETSETFREAEKLREPKPRCPLFPLSSFFVRDSSVERG